MSDKIRSGDFNDAVYTYKILNVDDDFSLSTFELFYKDGIQFREFGLPSMVMFSRKTGNIVREEWTNEKGQCHRTSGPAQIGYDEDTGEINVRLHYLNSKLVSMTEATGEIDRSTLTLKGLQALDNPEP